MKSSNESFLAVSSSMKYECLRLICDCYSLPYFLYHLLYIPSGLFVGVLQPHPKKAMFTLEFSSMVNVGVVQTLILVFICTELPITASTQTIIPAMIRQATRRVQGPTIPTMYMRLSRVCSLQWLKPVFLQAHPPFFDLLQYLNS